MAVSATAGAITLFAQNGRSLISLTATRFLTPLKRERSTLFHVVADAANHVVGVDYVGGFSLNLLIHRIKPLEVNPTLAPLEARFDDLEIGLLAVGVLNVQQILTYEEWVATMRLVDAV